MVLASHETTHTYTHTIHSAVPYIECLPPTCTGTYMCMYVIAKKRKNACKKRLRGSPLPFEINPTPFSLSHSLPPHLSYYVATCSKNSNTHTHRTNHSLYYWLVFSLWVHVWQELHSAFLLGVLCHTIPHTTYHIPHTIVYVMFCFVAISVHVLVS